MSMLIVCGEKDRRRKPHSSEKKREWLNWVSSKRNEKPEVWNARVSDVNEFELF